MGKDKVYYKKISTDGVLSDYQFLSKTTITKKRDKCAGSKVKEI